MDKLPNMSMIEQIAMSTYNQLIDEWDGEPSWEDFKQALEENRISTNKSLAAQIAGIPTSYSFHIMSKQLNPIIPDQHFIIFNISAGLALLTTPLAILLTILKTIGWKWIIISLFIGNFLKNWSKNGWADGLEQAAKQDEQVYQYLIKKGAFYFKPIESCTND